MSKARWGLRVVLIMIIMVTFISITSNADSSLKEVNDASLISKSYVNARSAYLETIKLYEAASINADYVIIDINKDGNPELIVRTGSNESNYNYHFYTFNISELKYLESVSGVHTTLYEMEEDKYIYALYAHMNYEQVTLYGLNTNNKLVKKVNDARQLKAGEEHIGGDIKIEFVHTSNIDYLYNSISDLTDETTEQDETTEVDSTVIDFEEDTSSTSDNNETNETADSFTNEISEEITGNEDSNSIEEEKRNEKVSYAEYMSNRKQKIIYILVGVIAVLVIIIYIMSKKKK